LSNAAQTTILKTNLTRSELRESANRVHILELERESLVQIRERYFDLIIALAEGGKISAKDISSFLPEKEAEKVGNRLASKSSLSFPVNVDKHFHPSGWMGDGEHGTTYITFLRSDSFIKISYKFGPKGWAGICWQYPHNNWGDHAGHNLISAKRVRFLAKGEKGNEIVEFKAGGIRGKKYEDSFEKSLEKVQLSVEWTRYEINLTDQDLSNVIGAFAWLVSKEGNQSVITFYLRETYFD